MVEHVSSPPHAASETAGRASSAPLLAARNIGRRDPDDSQWLLHQVSLSVNAGEDIAIVGPSGSGKTLLLRSLALLDPIDAGQILWRGKPIPASGVPWFRSHMIYLHQRAALLPGSVEDNLRHPFTLQTHRGKRFDPGRIVGWLAEIGRSADFLSRSVRDLSGGERQIVAILRTLQLDPEVLLLDEPTAALDAETSGTIESLVRHWRHASQPRGAVWVSHNLNQVRRIASRIVSIQGGRLQESS